jgi:hypothetical protein
VDIHLPTPGDVTCDSARNEDDARFIVQYNMGQRAGAHHCPLPAETLLLSSCDTNGDSACNVIDGLLVLQCAADMANALCGGENRPLPQEPAIVRLGFGTPVMGRAGVTLPITATVQTGILAAISIAVPFDPASVTALACQPDPTDQFALSACHLAGTAVHLTLIAPAGVKGTLPLANLTIAPSAHSTAPLPLAAQIATLGDVRGEAAVGETDTLILSLPTYLYLPVVQK